MSQNDLFDDLMAAPPSASPQQQPANVAAGSPFPTGGGSPLPTAAGGAGSPLPVAVASANNLAKPSLSGASSSSSLASSHSSAPSAPKSAWQQQWEAEQAERLATQRKEEEAKKTEVLAKAKRAVEDFYKERAEKRKQAQKNIRANEQATPNVTPTGGDVWVRVADLVDVSDKSRKSERDTSKFKSILTDMKSKPIK